MTKEISCGIVLYKYAQNQRYFLMIKQKNSGHFGFPKGHLESGESKKKTAIREVKEETNLDAFIIGNYYFKTTYSPKENVSKDVYYYLGKVYDGELFKQEQEIDEIFWILEKNVLNKITYESDKRVFRNLLPKINRIEKGISLELMSYIEEHIIPRYKQFDKAHHVDHVFDVIFDSLKLSKTFDVNMNYIYTIAAFHDLGLKFGRETHHITGGDILKEDLFIQSFFKPEEISLMVDAIYDHRASHGVMPRTIYGKIIAEADRQMNAQNIIERTALYETSKHPDLSIDQQVDHCYEHMLEKYSDHGYLQLCLDIGKNAKELEKLRKMIRNETYIRLKFKEIIMKRNK
ncbi:MAG: NUDIX domain-containing protein [Acholeplasmataceae bacterium]